jgi:hypothetical protein
VSRAPLLFAVLALAGAGCDLLFPKMPDAGRPSADGAATDGAVDAGTSDGPDMAHYAGGDVPVGATPYRLDPEVNAEVPPGAPVAYAITYSAGAFRLQWIGAGATAGSRFTGSIWTRGQFTGIAPGCQGSCVFDSGDYLSQPTPAPSGGQRLDFDTPAPTNVTGLDFTVSSEPVYFNLLVDGQSAAVVTYFPDTDLGGQTRNPNESPFALSTQ